MRFGPLTAFVPRAVFRLLRRYSRWPPVGRVRFGDLRRLQPISAEWGSDRGRPIDRYYIERFLARHAEEIRGRTLEIGTDMYTRRFGGDRVERSDVLHVAEERPEVTLVADLATGEGLPAETFDCVILTQTLQVIYDVAAAVATTRRILKPGGCLLATVPGISKISRYDMDRWGHYWSFTTRSAERLFGEHFPSELLEVEAHGNVLAATAFLHGIGAGELHEAELAHVDPDYQLLITVRAKRP